MAKIHNELSKIDNCLINSDHPCLIVLLLDQSGSMAHKMGNENISKSEMLAGAVNELICEIGMKCIGSGRIKNRFDLALIGYGNDENSEESVASLWQGNLVNHFINHIEDILKNPAGYNDNKPFWVVPKANGSTPMTRAFIVAKEICEEWINWNDGYHRFSHPPIIINVTDGEVSDHGGDFILFKDAANKLRELKTDYGNALLYNIHISSINSKSVLYPTSLPNEDNEFTSALFEITSPLTNAMIDMARKYEYNIREGAKGYIFNGDAKNLIQFLNVSSSAKST